MQMIPADILEQYVGMESRDNFPIILPSIKTEIATPFGLAMTTVLLLQVIFRTPQNSRLFEKQHFYMNITNRFSQLQMIIHEKPLPRGISISRGSQQAEGINEIAFL